MSERRHSLSTLVTVIFSHRLPMATALEVSFEGSTWRRKNSGLVERQRSIDINVGTDHVGEQRVRHVRAHATVNLGHRLRVLAKERLDVLATLTHLLTLVGEPGAGLLHEAQFHGDVENRSEEHTSELQSRQ